MAGRSKSIVRRLGELATLLAVLSTLATAGAFILSIQFRGVANSADISELKDDTTKKFEKIERQYDIISTGQARIEQKVDDIRGALNIKHRDDK